MKASEEAAKQPLAFAAQPLVQDSEREPVRRLFVFRLSMSL